MKQNKLGASTLVFSNDRDRQNRIRDNQLLFQVKSGTQMITQLQRTHHEIKTEKQTVLKKYAQF